MRVILSAIGFLLLVGVFAIGAHAATVAAFPRFAMDQAMTRLTNGGEGVNRFVHAPRVTGESRAIVRPSPDMAYSACVFDLYQGPVTIQVGPGTAYWSLSLYDRSSNAFAVFNDVQHPEGVTVTLITRGSAPPEGAEGLVVESPTRRGIALARRLAPSGEAFAQANAARQQDRCGN